MQNYTAIRCPNDRPHGKYQLCGRLVGVIKDKKIFLYCEDCKNFYELIIKENNHVEMVPLDKNTRLNLTTGLRVITNDY